MSSGDVLSDVLAGYRTFARYLAPLSLLLTLLVVLLAVVLGAAPGALGEVAADIVVTVGAFWVVAILVQSIHDLLEGDGDPWIGERFKRFGPYVNEISLATLLLGALLLPGVALVGHGHMLLGLVLLLAALALLVFFAVAIPVVVIDGYGALEALARSRELVRGHALTVLWVIAVVGLLTGIVSRGAGHLAFAVSDSFAVSLLVAGVLDALVTTPLLALTAFCLYARLMELEEAAEPAPAAS